MLVCINENNRVLWLHDDDSLKDTIYEHDVFVFKIDKAIRFAQSRDKTKQYTQMWDNEKQEIYLEEVKTTSTRVIDIDETTQVSSMDNMINMDMLLMLDEKLNLIIEHLGL